MIIDSILKFAEFLNKFREVERIIFANGLERDENDQEHSYSLAMLAWYINTTAKLNLDTEKLMKYALAHDLVEVYAGDTYFYQTNQETLNNKQEKEREAALKIKENFEEFPELFHIIEEYEKREDEESKFIYALDKLEPMLKIYLDKGRSWKRDKITLNMAKEMKPPKVKAHPAVEKYFHELLVYLEQDQKELFSPEESA